LGRGEITPRDGGDLSGINPINAFGVGERNTAEVDTNTVVKLVNRRQKKIIGI